MPQDDPQPHLTSSNNIHRQDFVIHHSIYFISFLYVPFQEKAPHQIKERLVIRVSFPF
jgi:hypothetical protein